MDDDKRDYYKEYNKSSFQMWHYAIQRIDLLIISISGAGIWLVLEMLKFSIINKLSYVLVIKIAGALFVFSIIINFISQFKGKKANEYALNWSESNLDEDPVDKIDMYRNKMEVYNAWVEALNVTAIISMISGLLIILSYFFFTF